MSVEQIRSQLILFLKTATPQVLCIRGKWGTGKTYIWQKTVEKLRPSKDAIAPARHAFQRP